MRLLIVLTIVLGSVLFAPLTVAQEATPDASPPVGGILDLPALVLTPADLEAAGHPGYAESAGQLAIGPEEIAAAYGEEMAAVAERLTAAGIERSYTVWHGLVDPDSGETPREILVYIDQYAGAAEAEAGYEVDVDTGDDPTVEVIPDTRTVGEQSQVTLYRVPLTPATPGTPEGVVESLALDLEFRLGTMNAGVTIVDYTGQQADVAEVEALAGALLAKLESAQAPAAPALSFHGLRLTPAVWGFDGYYQRDGMIVPITGEPAEARAAREALYGAAMDVYRTSRFVAAGDAGDTVDDIRVGNTVIRFPDAEAATAQFAQLPALLAADPTLSDLTERENVSAVGDATLALEGIVTLISGETAPISWVAVQHGPEISLVSARSTAGGIPPATMDTLAIATLTCLESDEWCPPVSIPADLVAQATPTP